MPTEILMPALSPTMEEGMIAKWIVKVGDFVSSGDLLAEIETDKAVMEFEAVDEGIVGKLIVEEGTAGVKVNEPIAVLLEEGESLADSISVAPRKTEDSAREQQTAQIQQKPPLPIKIGDQPAESSGKSKRIFSSPLARRIAAEKGLDLSMIKGSGPRGRIVKSDVLAAASKPETAVAPKRSERIEADELAFVRKTLEGRQFEEIKTRWHAQDNCRALDGIETACSALLLAARVPNGRSYQAARRGQRAFGGKRRKDFD